MVKMIFKFNEHQTLNENLVQTELSFKPLQVLWFQYKDQLWDNSSRKITHLNNLSLTLFFVIFYFFQYEFVSSIFNFMLSFNNLHLNDTEIGLFSALVLLSLGKLLLTVIYLLLNMIINHLFYFQFYTERFGISDIKAIHRIQESIAEALRLQIIRHHSNDTQLHPNVMMKLPELVQLGIKHAEHLSWFRGNWTKLKLPPLFAEIFDIPKSEDELLLVAQWWLFASFSKTFVYLVI